MNNCGPCLTSPADAQQCRAIRLFLWNCEPRSQPLPVLTVSKGITRLALQLGSVELARRWLARWNLAYLDRRASCRPLTVSPLTKGQGTLDYLSTPPGFAVSGDWFTPDCGRSVSWVRFPDFRGGQGSTSQRTSSATVVTSAQNTFVDPQLSSVSNLSISVTAEPPLSTLSSLRGDAGLALQDHRDLVTSFPSNAPGLTAVSERIEEVETTQVSVDAS